VVDIKAKSLYIIQFKGFFVELLYSLSGWQDEKIYLMKDSEEADEVFDQFIRDNLPSEIVDSSSEEDIKKLFNELQNTPPEKQS